MTDEQIQGLIDAHRKAVSEYQVKGDRDSERAERVTVLLLRELLHLMRELDHDLIGTARLLRARGIVSEIRGIEP